MQRPYRTLENGVQELVSDEEYIEFLAKHYEIDILKNSSEHFADFYTKHVHDILKFHVMGMDVEGFLKIGAQDFALHNEAFQRAKSSSKTPPPWNNLQ